MVADQRQLATSIFTDRSHGDARRGDRWMVKVQRSEMSEVRQTKRPQMLGSFASTPEHEQMPIHAPNRSDSTLKPQSILEDFFDLGGGKTVDSLLQFHKVHAMRRGDPGPNKAFVA